MFAANCQKDQVRPNRVARGEGVGDGVGAGGVAAMESPPLPSTRMRVTRITRRISLFAMSQLRHTQVLLPFFREPRKIRNSNFAPT